MNISARLSRIRAAIERQYDAAIAPGQSSRPIILMLCCYWAVWTLYSVIAKAGQDIHFDMSEMEQWSHVVGLGTPKHPPLAAWLVAVWFKIFPRQDWAYYFLAMLLPTVALWATWRLCLRYLPRDKCLVGLSLLTLVPFYNFQALKFNANSVLIPFWALTTWWFLCSLETRLTSWAILAGVGAAASMLGKYWSITLLGGLGVAALLTPDRSLYWKSAAPYVTAIVAIVLFAPHVAWLFNEGFPTFKYAMEAHPAAKALVLKSATGFLLGSIGYAVAPLILTAIVARPKTSTLKEVIWPSDATRGAVFVCFTAPFLIAIGLALLLNETLSSLWAMPMMTLLPIVLLSSPQISISRQAGVFVYALAHIFPLAMLAIAPIIAVTMNATWSPNDTTAYRAVALAVEQTWRAQTNSPLRIVGTDADYVSGFYFADEPLLLNIRSPALTRWVTDEDIRRDGMVLVCAMEPVCLQLMEGFAEHYDALPAATVSVTRNFLVWHSPSVQYRMAVVLPQSQLHNPN